VKTVFTVRNGFYYLSIYADSVISSYQWKSFLDGARPQSPPKYKHSFLSLNLLINLFHDFKIEM